GSYLSAQSSPYEEVRERYGMWRDTSPLSVNVVLAFLTIPISLFLFVPARLSLGAARAVIDDVSSGVDLLPDWRPDWPTYESDLFCPLCGYNLRGLEQPRCPECGYAFAWRQLLVETRNRHPYL